MVLRESLKIPRAERVFNDEVLKGVDERIPIETIGDWRSNMLPHSSWFNILFEGITEGRSGREEA